MTSYILGGFGFTEYVTDWSDDTPPKPIGGILFPPGVDHQKIMDRYKEAQVKPEEPKAPPQEDKVEHPFKERVQKIIDSLGKLSQSAEEGHNERIKALRELSESYENMLPRFTLSNTTQQPIGIVSQPQQPEAQKAPQPIGIFQRTPDGKMTMFGQPFDETPYKKPRPKKVTVFFDALANITTATAFTTIDGRTVAASGLAMCSPADSFDLNTGKKIAWRRAIKALAHECIIRDVKLSKDDIKIMDGRLRAEIKDCKQAGFQYDMVEFHRNSHGGWCIMLYHGVNP